MDPFEQAERLALEATENPALIPQYIEATKHAQALEGAPGWKGRTRMTQAEKILNHIKTNGSITQREAYLDHSIQSFHRRLTDLKDAGYRLRGEVRTNKVTGQEYTRYFLVGA
jgi:predicted HTH transcriptional regulator